MYIYKTAFCEDFSARGHYFMLYSPLSVSPSSFHFPLPFTHSDLTVKAATDYMNSSFGGTQLKNSPDRGLRYLLTLTLTSDDLESHIVVNVSSTSYIVPSFTKIGQSRFFGKV